MLFLTKNNSKLIYSFDLSNMQRKTCKFVHLILANEILKFLLLDKSGRLFAFDSWKNMYSQAAYG